MNTDGKRFYGFPQDAETALRVLSAGYPTSARAAIKKSLKQIAQQVNCDWRYIAICMAAGVDEDEISDCVAMLHNGLKRSWLHIDENGKVVVFPKPGNAELIKFNEAERIQERLDHMKATKAPA